MCGEATVLKDSILSNDLYNIVIKYTIKIKDQSELYSAI